MPRSHDADWTVYSLIDPRTGDTRYVGVTFDLRGRIRSHERACVEKRLPLAQWLSELGGSGLLPVPKVLETGTGDQYEAEKRWIAALRETGSALTNSTLGGPGQSGHIPSPETNLKRREAMLGLKRPPEFAAMMKRIAAKRPPEYYDQFRERNKSGWKQTPEAREKMRLAKAGKPWSAARRKVLENTFPAWTGRTHTPEARAKISAGKKGKKLSPEHKAQMSINTKRQWQEKREQMLAARRTPEAKAKRSASMKAARARERAERTKQGGRNAA